MTKNKIANTTGSSTPNKIQPNTDPKQTSFLVQKTSLALWRRCFLLRYFVKLGEDDNVSINWIDYDNKNKKIELNDENEPFKPTLPTELFKTIIQISVDKQKFTTITVYYTTGKVHIQGNATHKWIESEMKMLKETVPNIQKRNVINPDELINDIEINVQFENANEEKSETKECEKEANQDEENGNQNEVEIIQANTNLDILTNNDIVETIHTLEQDHVKVVTDLRKDIKAFKTEILEAITTLSGKVKIIETKISELHTDDNKKLDNITETISKLHTEENKKTGQYCKNHECK